MLCLTDSKVQCPFSTLQPMHVSSQRARSMWTWWGWICLVLATPWCTAVSMASSWRGVLNTESARVTALGQERCRYVEVKKKIPCFWNVIFFVSIIWIWLKVWNDVWVNRFKCRLAQGFFVSTHTWPSGAGWDFLVGWSLVWQHC